MANEGLVFVDIVEPNHVLGELPVGQLMVLIVNVLFVQEIAVEKVGGVIRQRSVDGVSFTIIAGVSPLLQVPLTHLA